MLSEEARPQRVNPMWFNLKEVQEQVTQIGIQMKELGQCLSLEDSDWQRAQGDFKDVINVLFLDLGVGQMSVFSM